MGLDLDEYVVGAEVPLELRAELILDGGGGGPTGERGGCAAWSVAQWLDQQFDRQ